MAPLTQNVWTLFFLYVCSAILDLVWSLETQSRKSWENRSLVGPPCLSHPVLFQMSRKLLLLWSPSFFSDYPAHWLCTSPAFRTATILWGVPCCLLAFEVLHQGILAEYLLATFDLTLKRWNFTLHFFMNKVPLLTQTMMNQLENHEDSINFWSNLPSYHYTSTKGRR